MSGRRDGRRIVRAVEVHVEAADLRIVGIERHAEKASFRPVLIAVGGPVRSRKASLNNAIDQDTDAPVMFDNEVGLAAVGSPTNAVGKLRPVANGWATRCCAAAPAGTAHKPA